eukprot:3619894-Amphidinium_carterae.1
MLRCKTTRGLSSVAGSHEEKHSERLNEWPGAKGLKIVVIASVLKNPIKTRNETTTLSMNCAMARPERRSAMGGQSVVSRQTH